MDWRVVVLASMVWACHADRETGMELQESWCWRGQLLIHALVEGLVAVTKTEAVIVVNSDNMQKGIHSLTTPSVPCLHRPWTQHGLHHDWPPGLVITTSPSTWSQLCIHCGLPSKFEIGTPFVVLGAVALFLDGEKFTLACWLVMYGGEVARDSCAVDKQAPVSIWMALKRVMSSF